MPCPLKKKTMYPINRPTLASCMPVGMTCIRLENPKVEKAIALHVFPNMETGKAGFKSGMYMASTDELYLTVNGKGGHAAMPAEYTNPLLIASEILLMIEKQFMNPNALKGT